MSRPSGTAPGTAGFVLAWLGGLAVARLTGATAVVIVLATALAAAVVAAVGGWRTVRRVRIDGVTLPAQSVAGTPVPIEVAVAALKGAPVWLEVHAGGERVAGGWAGAALTAAFPHRGDVSQVRVTARAPGALGLVWWRRSVTVAVTHAVAPRAERGSVTIEPYQPAAEGDHLGAAGAIAGDTDGVRPWRDGDSERSVHWASSLRARELVVHDRRRPADHGTVVRATVGSTDPDAAAGAALAALVDALAAGGAVWAAAGSGTPVPIDDRRAAERWAASVDLGAASHRSGRRPTWLQTDVLAWLRRPIEPDSPTPRAARWWAAAATLVALFMLANSLEYGPLTYVLAALGVAVGAAVSSRGGDPPGWVRVGAGAGALAAVALVAAGAGRLDGLLAVLRGPLPQLLIVLIVLHGFECRDRRTIRVGLAISSVVVMYAAGFLVDRSLGVWLAAWAVCCAVALARLATRPAGRAALGPRIGAVASTAVLAMALLALVPIPPGPAELTLPTLIRDAVAVGSPGALAGPDGRLRPARDAGNGERAGSSPSDYTGFAESLDTNVRGELGDAIVMRVRADQPDFWRGQTFAEFDGRTWYADRGRGVPLGGPDVDVPNAFGDPIPQLGRYSLEPVEFTQTFFIEQDQPNLLYHAYQPDRVVVDSEVWARADGALRSSTVLPAGSVYTVVSHRRPVTEEWLRRSGDVASRLTSAGRQAFERYLEVPASTSAATRGLADRLAAGHTTTYDVVRAYEAWIDANVTYDLNAPLPADGDDAVHDLLFGSRRGFCEQIASALVVMLRTQGVPARLATGYTPGTRDPVAGVWEVRARNAHAWAEVWFPEVGWQAFDPTAGVPLAGDTDTSTVGAGVLGAVGRWSADHPALLAAFIAVPLALLGVARLIIEVVRRRRRGRWGVLQDRYTALAERAGAPTGATNRRKAEAWTAADDAALAHFVAEQLDAAAFDPDWSDDDTAYRATRTRLKSL